MYSFFLTDDILYVKSMRIGEMKYNLQIVWKIINSFLCKKTKGFRSSSFLDEFISNTLKFES